jgi:methylmalonyl-CoA/ethylmalonyl-CoA epimerase
MSGGLLRLHHVGFIVASIEEALSGFERSLNAVATTGKIHDPLQKVNVLFLRVAPDYARIELVEPSGADSPVQRFLQQGGGMNHLCYEVEDIEASLRAMKEQKSLIISRPKPAVAFEGRRVAWAMTREKLLVELLEVELRDTGNSAGPHAA